MICMCSDVRWTTPLPTEIEIPTPPVGNYVLQDFIQDDTEGQYEQKGTVIRTSSFPTSFSNAGWQKAYAKLMSCFQVMADVLTQSEDMLQSAASFH